MTMTTKTTELENAAEKLAERVDVLGALIRKHPLAATGIGFGLGYLIARLVR
jgi:hypothetical protein